jgi:hypothetical protein
VPTVDVQRPEGKLFQQLAGKLFARHTRLERLHRYYVGDPPLPESLAQIRDVARDFFATSRTNFAELVAEAPRERMRPAGVRITTLAEGNDEDGDQVAWDAWQAAGLPIVAADVHEKMFSLGDGYAIVDWDKGKDRPVVTCEDPRQVVTREDPRTGATTAALKVYRDHDDGKDVAYLYEPGQVLVAHKPASEITPRVTYFNAGDWEWDEEASAALPSAFADVIPVVRFRNRGGVAEFEWHVDVLDRINRTSLRRLVIATFQAYKQRAAMGSFPERDDDGNLIDYQAVYRSGPDAFWLMPPDAKIWESGQVDLSGIGEAIKQDVLFLAAVTRTPLSMITPDAAAQAAEGASLQREGLVFKTEDRIVRASSKWSEVLSLMFRFAGDAARSTPETVQVLWAPVERYSIAERANAIAQTKGVLPRYQQLTEIWGMSPSEARRALTELQSDLLLDQQFALAAAPARGGNVAGTGAPLALPGGGAGGG